jgi:hypothetical protein
LSNIVKCNNTTTVDTTPESVKSFCINDLKVIWKEIETLSPKRVIFYTNVWYNDYIDMYNPKGCVRAEDLADTQIDIGNKVSPYWHRRFFDAKDNVICDFLVLGHPARLDKEDFICTVLSWMNETN